MKRAFLFLTLSACAFFCASQTAAKDQEPSAKMRLILDHHRTGESTLDVKELPRDQTKAAPGDKDMPEYEVYEVPYPPGVADYFSYKVYLHTPSGRYWIHQSGGFAGVSHFYGPGLLKDLLK